jgi:hypothetical protein
MLEYKILKSDSLVNESQLNDLALEGWRLVTIVKDGQWFYFYFERHVIKPTTFQN